MTYNVFDGTLNLATSTEQFSRALKTHSFTLGWSCGSPWRLWLIISTDELWRRIQIDWLFNSTQLVQCHYLPGFKFQEFAQVLACDHSLLLDDVSGTTYLCTYVILNLPSWSSASCSRGSHFAEDSSTHWLLSESHTDEHLRYVML